jgi:hypothetical protein
MLVLWSDALQKRHAFGRGLCTLIVLFIYNMPSAVTFLRHGAAET